MDRVNSVDELIERTSGMPLERMRFFINQDRRDPKCFGIYYDMGTERWVVYKNKADGSRAVRYEGPDEAYAANELWMKIQSEIAMRRPAGREPRQSGREKLIMVLTVILILAVAGFWFYRSAHSPRRGYYRVNDDVYYYQDDYWYWYDDGDWVYYDAPAGEWYGDDGYYGYDYPYFDDESQRFENTEYYEEPSESDSDSSVFSSWDSSDTDWDSDW